jgi:hypothetical protein
MTDEVCKIIEIKLAHNKGGVSSSESQQMVWQNERMEHRQRYQPADLQDVQHDPVTDFSP